MFETIAVLLIFFVLIGFGLIFYARVANTSVSDASKEQFQLKAIQTAQLVSFLPELQCTSSTSANIVVDDCFDVLKVEALSSILNDSSNQKIKNEYYFDSFGFSKIHIKKIYPSVSEWTIYERTKTNSRALSSIKVPVSLYDAVSNSYGFGVLTVEVYD